MASAAHNPTEERKAGTSNGGAMLLLSLAVLVLLIWLLVDVIQTENAGSGLLLALGAVALVMLMIGFY